MEVLLDTKVHWNITVNGMGEASRSSLLGKVESTLALMKLIARPERASATTATLSKVIVPWEWFSVADNRGFMRHIDARVMKCAHLRNAERTITSFGGKISAVSDLQTALRSHGGVHPLDDMQERGLFEPISIFADSPWPYVLLQRIWLPKTLCEREKYAVLADIFWTMTHGGFPRTEDGCFTDYETSCTSSCTIPASFESDYTQKLRNIAELLNYNSWVDTVQEVAQACKVA